MFMQALISEGNDLYAVTPIADKREEIEKIGVSLIDIKMDRRGINPLKDVSLLFEYRKLVKKIKPELIITYTIKPNIYGGIVARITRTCYAVNITGLGTAFERDGFIKKVAIMLNKLGLKKAKTVFFENKANLDFFVNEGIIKSNQAHLLHGAGVDIDHFSIKKYPEDNDGFKFLFIGRIMKEKGIIELIDAMKLLRSNGIKCSLSVLGGFDEEELQGLVRECSDEGWMHYHGIQSDVRPYIEQAHCFVLPSYHEGMANTNLECAACGRPIITSNIPGCKEAVINGVSGFLCESKDANSLYNAMLKICKMSNKEREEMGIAGRKHVESVFDKRKVVEDTIKTLLED